MNKNKGLIITIVIIGLVLLLGGISLKFINIPKEEPLKPKEEVPQIEEKEEAPSENLPITEEDIEVMLKNMYDVELYDFDIQKEEKGYVITVTNKDDLTKEDLYFDIETRILSKPNNVAKSG